MEQQSLAGANNDNSVLVMLLFLSKNHKLFLIEQKN